MSAKDTFVVAPQTGLRGAESPAIMWRGASDAGFREDAMRATHQGSCHCGTVAFEATLDLDEGTGRCNCSFCAKTRNWGAIVRPADFRQTAGWDETGAYSFGTYAMSHRFCRICGIRTFSTGHIPEMGGDVVSVAVAALDGLDPATLAVLPVRYFDGLRDDWMAEPAETRHL